ncbi:MAG: hypothetical protein KGL29_13670, partial [Alphaproteobacteria bacterium]|nr:hypothetical protein [Alphaproteobacteria bacterium]
FMKFLPPFGVESRTGRLMMRAPSKLDLFLYEFHMLRNGCRNGISRVISPCMSSPATQAKSASIRRNVQLCSTDASASVMRALPVGAMAVCTSRRMVSMTAVMACSPRAESPCALQILP